MLHQYTQQLIENYYALPEYEQAFYAHEEYHILVRTGTLQELIANFVVECDVQACCDSIAQFYVQRYEQQFDQPHTTSIMQQMENLAHTYHL